MFSIKISRMENMKTNFSKNIERKWFNHHFVLFYVNFFYLGRQWFNQRLFIQAKYEFA